MYKAIRNRSGHQNNKRGLSLEIRPITEWTVCWVQNDSQRVVAYIPDNLPNPEGAAKGVAAAMNRGDILLPL